MERLSGDDLLLGRIMLEHEEYHAYFDQCDPQAGEPPAPTGADDPIYHILTHTLVEQQLATRKQLEIYQFYNAMRNKRVDRHEIIHMLGAIFAQFVDTEEDEDLFYMQSYLRELKRLKTLPAHKV